MKRHIRTNLLSSVALAGLFLSLFGGSGAVFAGIQASPLAANAFAHVEFEHTWDRTDLPVSLGQVVRSYYWGPAPDTGGLLEDYAEGPGGKRLVQYFDKSRMEINNPNGNPTDPFFVTNGLLTVELISGKMQVGNNSYVSRPPAQIPLASDTDDLNAPTYVSFQGVSNTTLGDHPSGDKTGQTATATINKAGQVGNNPAMANFPGTNFVYFDPTTHHNVPKAFWDFLNQSGPTYDPGNGQVVNGRLSDPWFYTTGLPISEPYWAKVKIANQPNQDVLIQAFERRVVTYVPSAPAAFQVQMSNIGQHYHQWRYSSGPPPTVPVPTPTVPSTPVPSISAFVGTWLNNDAGTGSVAKLWITNPDPTDLTLHWFGPCGDTLCDNGTATAPYTGQPFNVSVGSNAFTLSFTDPQYSQLQVMFRGNNSLLFHRTLARDYFGTWLNDTTSSTTLGKLWITNNAQTLTVKWFSVCSPGFCSNQSKPLTYVAEPVRITLDGHTFSITCDNAGCSKLSVIFDEGKNYRFHNETSSTFNGTWNNVNPATTGIVKLVITSKGNPVHVHWYNACTPTPCDMGTASASFNTEPLVVSGSGYRLTITIENLAANKLKAVLSQSGQADRTFFFQK